ncbi:MAG: DUF4956 domain-containing protein [Candidatus Fermentibacteraceae bacterium]
MSELTEWFAQTHPDTGYSPLSIVINLVLALICGLVIGWVYRKSHRGLSYSQSFVVTLVLMAVTVGAVMMVIGSNLARAFALVGALTIVRFRTVVKDTRDTAFIFFALTEGIASGTGNYLLAGFSTPFISAIALMLAKTNYGAIRRSEYILRFRFDRTKGDEEGYVRAISDLTRSSTLVHIEPGERGRYLTLSYDITLEKGATHSDLIARLEAVHGVDSINMVASTEDVAY